MSEPAATTNASPTEDENQNKNTPTKRTPSKRKSHIERIQEESKEILKNMGIEELTDARSTRRTRSSTKAQTPIPTTPPTPRSQPSTPSSSRRPNKKKVNEEEPSDKSQDDVKGETSPKQSPPLKRQKHEDVTKDEQQKQDSVEAEKKIDETDTATSQESNGSVDKMDVDEQPTDKVLPAAISEESQEDKKLPLAKSDEPSKDEVSPETINSPETQEISNDSARKETAEVKVASPLESEPVEAMEVDSHKAVGVQPTAVNDETKEDPKGIVSDELEHKVSAEKTILKEVPISPSTNKGNNKADEAFSAVEEKGEVVVEEESRERPSVSEEIPKIVIELEAQAEPTQETEISSENSSQADKTPNETLPSDNVTEQSKVENTQDEPISVPLETETAQ